jgi:hypothetical protein
MLLESKIVPESAIGAVRPEMTARFGVDQAERQARLPT